MARRTARCEHKRVHQRRAAGKIDGDEVFGFVVFERRPDAAEECGFKCAILSV